MQSASLPPTAEDMSAALAELTLGEDTDATSSRAAEAVSVPLGELTLGEDADAVSLRSRLPVVNFLDISDPLLRELIVHEALPQDQDRFDGYMSHRPLGIALIAAPVSLTRSH